MPATESPPLILFSGLAADANVFISQKAAFPNLIVPQWPVPQAGDTLDSYCDRLANELQQHTGAIIGGASFGGIIALHVASRMDPLAVVLIGSVRSPKELATIARLFHPVADLVRFIPFRLLQFCAAPVTSKTAGNFMPHLCGLARQFRNADVTVLKWSLARILDWNCEPKPACPIFQIHGDRDFVLPARYTQPDTIVNGGGHVISLTHAGEVNEFLRSVIAKVRA
jgi:pimeloyl-ACP methyl ester carboxylesterase